MDSILRSFFDKRKQLSTEQDCSLREVRVGIAPAFRMCLPHERHEVRPGAWWPLMGRDRQLCEKVLWLFSYAEPASYCSTAHLVVGNNTMAEDSRGLR